MKMLITGANGQLGQELMKQLKSHSQYIVKGYTKKQLDVTNTEKVEKVFYDFLPDIVIHAAAFTAVDLCEKKEYEAYNVNSKGAFNVALAAKDVNAEIVYISTDYVFDGKKQTPYLETDPAYPLNIYGKSKLLGEKVIEMIQPKSYIIRTSWLYGPDGNNFVNTMLRFAKQRKEVKVVNDQIGSPTYTKDLAEKITELLGKPYGIYHISNSKTCSWYQFAQAIFQEAGYNSKLITPVTTKEYGAIVQRPAYSVLAHTKLKEEGVLAPRSWEQALKEYIKGEGNR